MRDAAYPGQGDAHTLTHTYRKFGDTNPRANPMQGPRSCKEAEIARSVSVLDEFMEDANLRTRRLAY